MLKDVESPSFSYLFLILNNSFSESLVSLYLIVDILQSIYYIVVSPFFMLWVVILIGLWGITSQNLQALIKVIFGTLSLTSVFKSIWHPPSTENKRSSSIDLKFFLFIRLVFLKFMQNCYLHILIYSENICTQKITISKIEFPSTFTNRAYQSSIFR